MSPDLPGIPSRRKLPRAEPTEAPAPPRNLSPPPMPKVEIREATTSMVPMREEKKLAKKASKAGGIVLGAGAIGAILAALPGIITAIKTPAPQANAVENGEAVTYARQETVSGVEVKVADLQRWEQCDRAKEIDHPAGSACRRLIAQEKCLVLLAEALAAMNGGEPGTNWPRNQHFKPGTDTKVATTKAWECLDKL